MDIEAIYEKTKRELHENKRQEELKWVRDAFLERFKIFDKLKKSLLSSPDLYNLVVNNYNLDDQPQIYYGIPSVWIDIAIPGFYIISVYFFKKTEQLEFMVATGLETKTFDNFEEAFIYAKKNK